MSLSTRILYLIVLHCSILLVFATSIQRHDNNEFFVSFGHWHSGGDHRVNHHQHYHQHSMIHASVSNEQHLQLPSDLLENKRFDNTRMNPFSIIGRNFAGSILARALKQRQQQQRSNRRIISKEDTSITSTSSSVLLPNNSVILASSTSTLSAPTITRPHGNNHINALWRFLSGRKLASTTLRRQQPTKPASPGNDGILVETFVQEDATTDPLVLKALTQPIIPQNIWDRLTGREFQEHPDLVDELVKVGEDFARNDAPNDWVDWAPFGDTLKGDLHEGDIHVWTGKCASNKKELKGYGTSVPWIKTRSIVPMSPQEMAELLLDSSRVKTYNAWSTGRKDMWTTDDGFTKIVKNKTQPPVVGSKAVVGVTLLHARPLLNEPGSWIVVSRAVGGTRFYDANGNEKGTGKSDILLGVNLLQPVMDDPDSSILTAVTHAYSAGVPTMLAERLGVSSAIKFVKDMRALRKPQYAVS